MILKISHIGIAVKDIEKTLCLYRDVLRANVESSITLEKSGLKIAFVTVGNSSLELMSSLEDSREGSTGDIISRFIKTRGEGIHHICFAVNDIKVALTELSQKGIELIDKEPRPGAHGKVAFLNPKSTNGVLIELCETESR